ncbi:MAG: dihydrolipoyl dehydrogenase [Treponema sp.]|jgi:dihydrolipoamide dehydrogenase|nr:dihydrolipoyl dehydrogenase [Treponema sp.]
MEYDIAVIGGGPAGYTAAIKAARLGAKTVLVEKDELGGTCLNRGCIPTKALLKTAELVHEILGAAERGIVVGGGSPPAVSVDMDAVIKEKNRVVKKLTSGVGALLKSNGVEVIKGEGKLAGAGTPGFNVAVQTQNAERVFSAKKVILAGGSVTAKLPIPGLDLPGVLGSTEILDIKEIPPRLAVIGGGVIGVEMAMVFQAFGSKVSIIEALPEILPLMDGEASSFVHSILAKRGADIYTGTGLQKIEKKDSGNGRDSALTLVLADGKTLEADKVLVSIGRTADLSSAAPSAGGLSVQTDKGKVVVNDYMESSVPGVFAPGDINGKKMLAHAAFGMAEAAAENAAVQLGIVQGGLKKAELDYIPQVVYSFPEAASAGLTQADAEKQEQVLVGKFPLTINGRALASGNPGGFVKVIAGKYGKILGVHIVGQGASEIINEAAALMAMEITVYELADIIHAHPTVSEALMEAAADALGRSIHLPPKK